MQAAGESSVSVDSTLSPKGVETNVTKVGVRGSLSFQIEGVPVTVRGAFTQKNTNGKPTTLECSAEASAKFDTALGKLTLTGGGKLDLKTNVLELSPGASLTVGDVKISGATTFNMKTGLMTKGNGQTSLNVTKDVALVQQINFDKKTVELGSGVTLKLGDPTLTLMGTYNLDTQTTGAQGLLNVPVSKKVDFFVSVDTDNNGAGRQVVGGGTFRF